MADAGSPATRTRTSAGPARTARRTSESTWVATTDAEGRLPCAPVEVTEEATDGVTTAAARAATIATAASRSRAIREEGWA